MGSSDVESSNGGRSQPHAFVFPYPVQGHIQPFMRLSKLLATTYGFLISFFNSEENHLRLITASQLNDPSSQEEDKLLDMRMLFLPDRPPSSLEMEEFSGSHIEVSHLLLSNPTTKSFLNTSAAALESLIKSQTPPITCLILDPLVALIAPQLAQNLGLPRFIFFTASAESLAMAIRGSESGDEVNPFPAMWSLFAQPFREKLVNENDMILINTAAELEGSTLEHLKEEGNKVYAIGPLLPTGGSLWAEDNSCLDWLDKQPAASVLFVSFGSAASLSATQLLELAFGLEASNQRILWAIRPDFIHGKAPNLPLNFLERIEERVFIISWAPQLRVLGHPSVGGFLSHCGWNSTIESIVSGVPILAWPFVGDQMMNAKSVVHTWHIGLPLTQDGLITQAHVESRVRDLMEREIGKELRQRARGLKHSIRSALPKGGSSSNNLHHLFRHASFT